MLLRVLHKEQALGQAQIAQLGADYGYACTIFSDQTRGPVSWQQCRDVLLFNGWMSIEGQPCGGLGAEIRTCPPGEDHLKRVYANFPAVLARPTKVLPLKELAHDVIRIVSGGTAAAAPAVASATTRSAPAAVSGRNDTDVRPDAANTAVLVRAIAALPFAFDDIFLFRVLQHQLQTPPGSKTQIVLIASKDMPILTQLFVESGRGDVRAFRELAHDAECDGWIARDIAYIEVTPRGIERIKAPSSITKVWSSRRRRCRRSPAS
jgi:hypothetical protein